MMPNLRANLLVNCLLKFFVVDDGSNLTLAVGSPKGSGYFNPGFTGINPKKKKRNCVNIGHACKKPAFVNIKQLMIVILQLMIWIGNYNTVKPEKQTAPRFENFLKGYPQGRQSKI